jgi:anhydro-N-acetylmuramic acid kinase
VLHRPEQKLTVQIGDGHTLAKTLGIPVVFDLRAADVAAGGQGAPLVPIYHRALVSMLKSDGPTVVVNIGGVANITFIDSDTLTACDTGPGNALLDDFMLSRRAKRLIAMAAGARDVLTGNGLPAHWIVRSSHSRRRNRSTAMTSPP